MRVKNVLGTATLCGFVLGGLGCVMPDQLSQLQKDVADVRQQLRRVQADQAESRAKLDQLETEASEQGDQVTRAEVADLGVRVDQVSRDVAVTDERMNDLGRRVDRVAQELQQARSAQRPEHYPVPRPPATDRVTPDSALPPAQPDGAAVPEPGSLYNTSYADFSKGNYALAISGFEEYREKFPDSSLADNALYWVGECHFSQGNFPDAINAFDRLLSLYPDSDKAPAGNLKKGLAYLEQNQIGQAIVQLRFVHATYPGSDEAKIARDKLASLGASI